MGTADEKNMVAPCGLYCGRCAVYLAKDDPAIMEFLVSTGLNRDKLPCQGCRQQEGKCIGVGMTKETWPNGPATGPCETYICSIKHGVDFCFECQEYPCTKLQPCSDMADVLPQNMKVFNLCYIERHGLRGFIEKDSELKEFPGLFYKRYYFGKMVIGKGPQIEESEVMARVAALGETIKAKVEKTAGKS